MKKKKRVTRIGVTRIVARFFIIIILAFIIILMTYSISKAENKNGVVGYAKCVSGTINIRDKGDFSGDVVGYLFNEDEVIVIGNKNGWTHILVGIEEGHGWVKSEFISAGSDTSSGEYINNSGARVRIRKKIESTEDCDWLENGCSISVTSITTDKDGNDWGRVELGWVMMSFLTSVQNNEE